MQYSSLASSQSFSLNLIISFGGVATTGRSVDALCNDDNYVVFAMSVCVDGDMTIQMYTPLCATTTGSS